MVEDGPGAALTDVMEQRLKQVAGVLNELADQVNRVMQRTGQDWQGGAADAAMNAMSVLRGIDDGMHFTSNLAGVRAFGQSDGAGWVRANMPPVVEVRPPVPTGGIVDVLNASVDFQQQQAAAKEAEQRAREIMIRYTAATRERAAGMTPLAAVPQVVLDIAPRPGPPIVEPPRRPRNPKDSGPPEGGPVQEPVGGPGPGETGAAQRNPAAPVVTPDRTQAAGAPGQGSAPVTAGSPSSPVPSGSGATATGSPPAGGFVKGEGSRASRESLGREGSRGSAGGLSRGGNLAGRGPAGARGMAARAGRELPFGVGQGARRDEDGEHKDRYGVPSAEHFEDADPGRDPHRAGWSVAPEVIGTEDDQR